GEGAGRRGADERSIARLHALAGRGILLVTATGFAFLRHGLREKLLDLLGPQRRRSIHARVPEALLALKGEASADHWDEIAVHFAGGGEPDKALEFHLKAARRAARLYANRRGISAFRASLALAGPRARGPIATELGRLHARIGEYPQAMECFQAAL